MGRIEDSWAEMITEDRPGFAAPTRSIPEFDPMRSTTRSLPERSGWRWLIGPATAAGLVALGVWLSSRPPTDADVREAAGNNRPAAVPVAANSNPFPPHPAMVKDQLLEAHDDGIIATLHSMPLRRLRYELLDTFRWENAADGSTLELTVPREEIWIVPVSTD
jgi:hypothetical protein